jgi:hypothetical protein
MKKRRHKSSEENWTQFWTEDNNETRFLCSLSTDIGIGGTPSSRAERTVERRKTLKQAKRAWKVKKANENKYSTARNSETRFWIEWHNESKPFVFIFCFYCGATSSTATNKFNGNPLLPRPDKQQKETMMTPAFGHQYMCFRELTQLRCKCVGSVLSNV